MAAVTGNIKKPERTTPRRKHVAVKGNGISKKKLTAEEKGKAKIKKKLFHHDGENDSGSSSSQFSNLDLEWVPGEEEVEVSDGEDFFQQTQGIGKESEILKQVQASLGEKEDVHEDAGGGIRVQEERDGDSDELRSLDCSDDEVDDCSYFNAEIDFKKPVEVKLGLKFNTSTYLRKALRVHAIENRA